MNKEKQYKLITEIQGDLPLRDIAVLAECSKKHWWSIKNGQCGISTKMAIKLSKLSGKSLDEILMI